MIKSYLLAIPFMLICCCYTADSQNKVNPRENTPQYVNPSAKNVKNFPVFLEPRNSALKINVSAIVRGDYCLSYERKLNKFMSAEVTAGITHYSKFFETTDFFNYRPYNMAAAKRRYNTQPSFKLAARHYFKAAEKEIFGSYISVEGMYRRYGYTVKNSYTSPTYKEYSDQKEIRLLWGGQNTDKNSGAFYDCSVGMGYRFHERRFLGYSDGNKYSTQEMITGKQNYFVFVINLKVGFSLH